jgi:Kef-type K+ transport system membrane component KefB
MIISGLVFIIACAVFAVYNALSIKGHTNTWQWHISQFAVVILFVTCGFFDWIKKMYWRWRENDFHNFGRLASVWLLLFALAVVTYVFSLHYLLGVVESWR